MDAIEANDIRKEIVEAHERHMPSKDVKEILDKLVDDAVTMEHRLDSLSDYVYHTEGDD